MQPREAAVNPSAVAGPFPTDSGSLVQKLTLLLLLVACLALRFWCLDCKPFWFDEAFSVEVARIDWRNFLHLLWWREANMSLYYLLLRFWLLLGHSPFFIRSLSVIIAAATLPAIYWLATLLFDRKVAFIAAALFAFNAYDVRYSQEARSYTLFVLLATMSSAFLIAGLRKPTRRVWIGYIAISILVVYAHLYALLLLGVHWIALHCWKRSPGNGENNQVNFPELRRAWIWIGIGVLPLIAFVAKTGAGPIRWIRRPGLGDLATFYEHLAGGNSWALLALFGVASVVAVAPFARQLSARTQKWEVWRCQFLLLWLLFPVALTALLSFARPVFLGRYLIFCLPALLLLASAGLARLGPEWILAVVLLGSLFLGWQGTQFIYANDFDNERDGSEAASSFVLEHAQAGDAIVFHIAETRIPYEFFRSIRAATNTASPEFTASFGPDIVFPKHGSGLDYRDFTGKPTAELLRTAAAEHRRVWVMLMNNGPAGNPDPTTLMIPQALPQSLSKVERWQFPKVEIRLYSKP